MANLDEDVKLELNKLSSAQLCSNVLGQACMYAVVACPQPGEESYELYMREKNQVLAGLKEKAVIVTDLLNKIEGVTCNPVQGNVKGTLASFKKLNYFQLIYEKN